MHALIKTKRRISWAFWCGALLVLTVNAVLLYNQLWSTVGYVSDYQAHLGFVMNDTKSQYSLYHVILVFAKRLLTEYGLRWVALGITIASNFMSMLFTRILLNDSVAYIKGPGCAEDFFAISIHVVSMVISGLPGFYNYLAQWSPNPWHNPTYILCRPFAVLTVVYMVRFYRALHNGEAYARYYAPLGISCLISVAVKPSFFFVFIVACFFFILIELIATKFASLKAYVLLALALIPSAVLILYQNFILFSHGSGVILTNGGVWKLYTPSVLFSILLGMAFPFYVIGWSVVKKKLFKSDFMFRISVITYFISTVQFYFLAEDNKRFSDANFAWGYCFGMFFMFIAAIVEFFLKDREKNIGKHIGTVIFGLHLISGIYYLCHMLTGAIYY